MGRMLRPHLALCLASVLLALGAALCAAEGPRDPRFGDNTGGREHAEGDNGHDSERPGGDSVANEGGTPGAGEEPSEAGQPPQATTTRPPQATTTRPPQATTTRPPQATTTRPPQATTTRPPRTTTTRPPSSTGPPNIVFITADDMGFTDAPWNQKFLPASLRGQIIAPTMLSLAEKGVIFDQGYALPKCTPSRAALMTGRYPLRYGLHKANVLPDSPYGLPLGETLLPRVMKRAGGYRTHHVGKWHLGHCDVRLTPTARGYDSSFGSYAGSFHYTKHSRADANKTHYGVMHYNTRPTHDFRGWYATDMFAGLAANVIRNHADDAARNRTAGMSSSPLFLTVFFNAPHSPIQPGWYGHRFPGAPSAYGGYRRRGYLGMMLGLDTAVRRIVNALKSSGLWSNTLLVFSSDNGGFPGTAMNYPLRGGKGKYYEGGCRVPMFAYHPGWHRRGGYRSNALVHLVDWLPTLAAVGGASRGDLPGRVDGIDFSEVLRSPVDLGKSPRQVMVYGAVVSTGRDAEGRLSRAMKGAYRARYWKIVLDSQLRPQRDVWYITTSPLGPPSGNTTDHKLTFNRQSQQNWGLFNLMTDPYEEHNVMRQYPAVFNELRRRLYRYLGEAVRPLDEIHPRQPEAAHPTRNGGFWTHGWC